MERLVTKPFESPQAIKLLLDAWRSGRQLTELPADVRPQTLDQGYDLQDCLIEELGEEVVGWKLGVGSVKGKRDSGIGRSIAGRVVKSRVYAVGDAVPLPDNAPATIELETAFVIGRDIAAGTAPIHDPLSVVNEARLCCEIVRSRFADRRAVGWPSFAADDGAFHALIIGPQINHVDFPRTMQSLLVKVDGQDKVRAAQGEDVTDPVIALQDFFHLTHERGMRIPRGSIVTTGSMSVPFNLESNALIEATCLNARLAFATTLRRQA